MPLFNDARLPKGATVMLFVSAIEPINHYTKRVIVADTETDFVGEVVYGEYLTDEQIRFRAPAVIETTDAFKKYKRKKGTN